MERKYHSRLTISTPYLVFLLFFYFFIFRVWLENQISIIGYADELIAALAIPIWLLNLRNRDFKLTSRKDGIGKWITIFVLLGFTGILMYQYQPILRCALPDAFLCMKFWLAMYTGKHILSRFKIEYYANQVYFHVRLVSWIFAVLIVADYAFSIFPTDVRYGLRSVRLFYGHPTIFAAVCAFLIVVLLMISEWVSCEKYLIFLAFLMCMSLRSKAFGAAMALAFIFYFVKIRHKPVRARTIIMFVPLIILIAWDQIYYYFFSSIQSDSARYQLLEKAVTIANDYFPFGAGFGTYASYYSGVYYSPLYVMYGLSGVSGLTESNPSFMSDSFWPAILGETGWFGFIAYVIAIVILFKNIQKIRRYNHGFYMAALFALAYEMIISVAEAAFFHPISIMFAFMIGYMLNRTETETELRSGSAKRTS